MDKSLRHNFQYLLGADINKMVHIIKLGHDEGDVDIIVENVISNYLLWSLDKNLNGNELILIKKEYD